MRGSTYAAAFAALLLGAAPLPVLAGRGAFLPTYHPAPCSGDECRADDPKSGSSCQGFLCGFVPAKAMQPPVTAAQAAEMERARAAAAAAQAAPPPPTKTFAAPRRKKRTARTAGEPTIAKPTSATPVTPAAPQ